MCVGGTFPHSDQQFPGHQRGVLPFTSALILSTHRQHQIPQVRAQFCKTGPLLPSEASCKPSLLILWLQIQIPTNVSLVSVNLLEQLTQLRETSYLLDYWCIMKGADQTKRCLGKGCATLTAPTYPTSPPALTTQSVLIFVEASIRRRGPQVIRDGAQPSGVGGGAMEKFQTSHHLVGSSGNHPPSLGGVQKHLIYITKDI